MSSLTELREHAEPIEAIRKLMDANRESAIGFTMAVDHVDSSSLASAFVGLAARRTDQLDELGLQMGVGDEFTAADPGPVEGDNRAWPGIQALFEGDDLPAALAEIESTEQQLATLYDEAIHICRADATLFEMLPRHRSQIDADLKELRRLQTTVNEPTVNPTSGDEFLENESSAGV